MVWVGIVAGIIINGFDYLMGRMVMKKYDIRLKWIHLADLILFLPTFYYLLKSVLSHMTLYHMIGYTAFFLLKEFIEY